MKIFNTQSNRLFLTAVLCMGVFGFASAASAATRYWVGGCTDNTWTCNNAGLTNWSATSGGTNNAAVPTSADDVFFDANSGTATSSISAAITINSLDMTGSTAGINHFSSGSSGQLTIAGNGVAFKLAPGKWSNQTTSCIVNFTGASGTTTITSNGNGFSNLSFNGSGIFVLADNTTLSSNGSVTLTAGTLHTDGNNDNSGLTHSWGKFTSANSNVRSLYLGNSTITITNGSGTVWDTGSNSTNLTIRSGTSNIIISSANTTFFSGTFAFNNVTFNSYGQILSAGNSTFNTVTFNDGTIDFEYLRSSITTTNLIFNGTTNGLRGLDISNDFTVTGTIQLNGNSSTNRILVRSGTLGIQRTITNAGATITAANADFRDINFSSPINLSNISGGSGDALGNSGITFTPSQTNYWVGNGGSWSDVNHWANTSGSTGGTGRVPLPQDDVRFDANSFTTTGQTVNADMPRIGRNIDWTGTVNNPTFNHSTSFSLYGSLIFNPNMNDAGFLTVTLEGRGAYVLTNKGKAHSGNVAVSMVGGTLTLQDDLSLTSTLSVNNGIFNANNFNVTTGNFTSNGTATRTILMGSKTWNLTGGFTNWNMNSTGLTFDPGQSTILLSAVLQANEVFTGAGLTYNNVVVGGGGAFKWTFTGNNSFNKFTINPSRTVVFTANTTNTFNQFIAKGTSGNLITLQSSTPGTKYTLKQTSGFVSSDWMNITDSTATGGAGWFAGTNSTLSNSTGWQLLQGPQQKGLTLQNGKVKIQKGKVKFQFR